MALMNAIASPKLPANSLASFSKGNHALSVRQAKVACSPVIKRASCQTLSTIRCSSTDIERSDFPTTFKFGASTSALQTESGPTDGGRGPSTWDEFIGDTPAVKSLWKYQDDVRCLKDMKVDVYRFSISWSRILPTGKISGEINQDGIDFYNNLIDELIKNGIEPCVTLFHFDLPTALQEAYSGFLSPEFVEDYKNYADLCFKTFGDRVKNWITFNEPEVFCVYGYKTDLPAGTDDPTVNPYKAGHHLLLAHATAARLYKDTYKAAQGGKIGLSLSAQWFLPLTNSPPDVDSTSRAWDFMVGWFLDPLTSGEYPFSMQTIVRDRLPTFTTAEQALVKGSYDFVGINYYTSSYAFAKPFSPCDKPVDYFTDQYLTAQPQDKNGVPIGPKAEGSDQIYAYPPGLGKLLEKIKIRYNNPEVFVTENGYPQLRDDSIPLLTALQDDVRIEWIKAHLNYVKEALSAGVNINGYFVWSLMDCMEMGSGYTVRYGLNYTDYLHDYARIPKKSAFWFNNFLSSAATDDENSKGRK